MLDCVCYFWQTHEIIKNFEGAVLTEALRKTFKRRNSAFEKSPIVNTIEFYKEGINLLFMSHTASRSYENIFESIVHSENYYQTFDIGRVNFLRGKMEGAFYCTEMIDVLYFYF